MNVDNRPNTAQKSGAKAGVEDGLSMVEAMEFGVPQTQQQFKGANMRFPEVEESAGTSKGKSFKFRS